MNEKFRFLLLSSAVSIVSAFATVQPATDHTPRDGDRLHPGLASSRSLILSVGDSSRTVVLDPTAVSYDADCDASPYIDGDTISYVQFAAKHRFLLRGDTLSYLGVENRATDFRLDRAAAMAVFPLRDGSAVSDVWSGRLRQYGAIVLKNVKGESRSEVDGGWTLTDGTDTLRNATRVRWTLDMAYADPDSVNSTMPDSVASGIISEMRVDPGAMLTERLLTERTMWFAEDARYPVLTDSRVSRILLDDAGLPADTVPSTSFAMHYPAAYQHSDTGEDMAARKPKDNEGGERHAGYGDDGVGQSTGLTVSDPEARGESISVSISCPSGQRQATVTLFSDSGIRLTEPVEVTVSPVPRQFSVPVPKGWSGVVLLRVDSGDETYTRKTII